MGPLIRKNKNVVTNWSYGLGKYIYIQLFRERLSGKVHATILKGIVGGFEFSFFFSKKFESIGTKGRMQMCLRVLKESNKSRFDSYSRQEPCTDHIPYYLSGLSRAHFFSDNLSRNSCISWAEMNFLNTTKLIFSCWTILSPIFSLWVLVYFRQTLLLSCKRTLTKRTLNFMNFYKTATPHLEF